MFLIQNVQLIVNICFYSQYEVDEAIDVSYSQYEVDEAIYVSYSQCEVE